MLQLTTSLLGQVCRLFMVNAYPEGPSTIPAKKRVYFELPADQPITAFLPPAPCAASVCEEIRGEGGNVAGYAFRLGSSTFPHLKLRVQQLKKNGADKLVFMVDTHDAFSKENRFAPPTHPDAPRWQELQNSNRVLKEKIETALEQQGLTTLNSMLRGDLQG